MNKFENVDVLAALSAIMKQNTAHYQSDFEIDEKIIRAAVDSADKNLLWFSRPSGTFCGIFERYPRTQYMVLLRGADP
jgi:hypothetical protein